MAKPLTIGTRFFKTKKAAEDECRAILYGYPAGATVTDANHHRFLDDLLLRHPDAAKKIGCGVIRFEVRQNPEYPRQRGIFLIRTDGTETDFSVFNCITPPTTRVLALDAMRHAIAPQVIAVAERAFTATQPARCALTGVPLASRLEAHVDHAEPTFLQLARTFVDGVGGWDRVEVGSTDGMIGRVMVNEAQREAWCAFHAERARLRVVSIQANLSLLRRTAQP